MISILQRIGSWRLNPLAAGWLLGCLLVSPAHAAAQQAAPTERVNRSAVVTATTTAITIDGALDEEAWRSAPTIGALIQRQPNVGEPPTERTDIILLHDRDNLYIGVVAYDTEPDRVIGTQMARDGSVTADDNIEILLDTFRDQRSAFYFATNPSGALVDGLATNGQLNTEWDAIWDVRTRRTSQGWVAEFAIPFKSLSFPAGQSVWGFNISRSIYRKLEDARWSGARLQTQFLQLSEAGQITNLEGLTQGVGLNVRPFIAGRWLRFGGTQEDDFNRKPGLDLFYNLTPSLKLTGTFNTDFGETEVDARQINLSRFSLLFPEKRSFFLEGAGVFNFASTGPDVPGGIPATGADVYPFFSRQIGLLSGPGGADRCGRQTDGHGWPHRRRHARRAHGRPRACLSSTKRTSSWDASNETCSGNRTSVASSRTVIQPSGSRARPMAPTCAWRRHVFWARSRNFVVNAYGARSVNEGRSDKDWSYGFSAHYPNDRFIAQVAFREIQENFKPALGFVQRDNVRLFRVAGSYNPRPKRFLNILQMNHDVFYTRFTRLDNGQLESQDLYVTWWDWHFKSGDNIHGILDFNPTYERLFEPFEISPGVILSPGEYRFTRFRNNLFTTASKRRSVRQRHRDVRQLLVGEGRAGADDHHLQAAAHGSRSA